MEKDVKDLENVEEDAEEKGLSSKLDGEGGSKSQ